jgi:hypothetical protein
MEDDAPFESIPTVNQLFLVIRHANKKKRRGLEKAGLFFLWGEIAMAGIILVLGLVYYGLKPSLLRSDIAYVAGWAFGALIFFSVLAFACNMWLVVGGLINSNETSTGGVDERIAVEKKLADRLRGLNKKKLASLADRVQLESSLVVRRIGIGALAITVLTFVSGVFSKSASTPPPSIFQNREAIFTILGVLAASLAMAVLYTIVDRLDRVAFVLKSVANQGKDSQ